MALSLSSTTPPGAIALIGRLHKLNLQRLQPRTQYERMQVLGGRDQGSRVQIVSAHGIGIHSSGLDCQCAEAQEAAYQLPFFVKFSLCRASINTRLLSSEQMSALLQNMYSISESIFYPIWCCAACAVWQLLESIQDVHCGQCSRKSAGSTTSGVCQQQNTLSAPSTQIPCAQPGNGGNTEWQNMA